MTKIFHDMERPWHGTGFVTVLLTIITGIISVVLQLLGESQESKGEIEDPWFVGIVMANTYAIYRFAMFLRAHLSQLAKSPSGDFMRDYRVFAA